MKLLLDKFIVGIDQHGTITVPPTTRPTAAGRSTKSAKAKQPNGKTQREKADGNGGQSPRDGGRAGGATKQLGDKPAPAAAGRSSRRVLVDV
eukprot:COSAG05_NODE_7686_length_779_cov_2.154412_1_plen_92_part_00